LGPMIDFSGSGFCAASTMRRTDWVDGELRSVQTISSSDRDPSRDTARRTISIAFCKFTVNTAVPPAFSWMPCFIDDRNRRMDTLKLYWPGNKFAIENEPCLSVNAILSGKTGDAATTITNAPTTGAPLES